MKVEEIQTIPRFTDPSCRLTVIFKQSYLSSTPRIIVGSHQAAGSVPAPVSYTHLDLYRAACAARERQADVLLFGHTHRAEITWDDGLLLFNPGSLSGGADSTYGTLDITPAGIVPNILRLRR